MWGRGQAGTLAALRDVEASLPFARLGLDSDNGGEFLNYHVWRWLRSRPRPVFITRSRPSKKDDNAHVRRNGRGFFTEGNKENEGEVRVQSGRTLVANAEGTIFSQELTEGIVFSLFSPFSSVQVRGGTLEAKEGNKENKG